MERPGGLGVGALAGIRVAVGEGGVIVAAQSGLLTAQETEVDLRDVADFLSPLIL